MITVAVRTHNDLPQTTFAVAERVHGHKNIDTDIFYLFTVHVH